jgi:carboxymethylenebutenolidase
MSALRRYDIGIDAAVSYYGVEIEKYVPADDDALAPVMLHIPVDDPYVGHDVQAELHRALDQSSKATLHDYAGAGHAFARSGEHYHAEATASAWTRTLGFLNEHLKKQV